MTAMTNYAEGQVLTWLLSASAATRPTAWFLALFTAAPGEAGGGTECAGAGYARRSIAVNVAANPATFPTVQQTFTPSGGTWGTVTHWALFDASTGGNMLIYGALSSSIVTADGVSFVAPIDSFAITAD